MNRRHLLGLGMVGSFGGLVPRAPAILRRLWDDRGSPATTPFVSPLPIPPPPIPVKPFAPSAVALEHLRDLGGGRIPPNTRFYDLVQEEALVRLHPALPRTPVWRYRDANSSPDSPFVPGPTFVVNQGDPQVIRHRNRLPEDHVGFGVPETTVHFHGGHVLPLFDGFPENVSDLRVPVVISPGQQFDYVYAMQDVGFSEGAPDPDERKSMLWYHDHSIDFTGPNVYRGLAALYLIFDQLDTGNEHTGLRLPGPLGVFDIPMVIQDRRIARDGSLVYLPEDFDGFLGDKFLVNGAINPFLRVKRRKYRFRILNGSNARFYLLSVIDGRGARQPFDIIANEGGLLAHPLREQRKFLVSNAEQIEFVLDFSHYQAGTELFLADFLDQDSGRGPGGDFANPDQVSANEANRIVKFVVEGGSVEDPSRVPDDLRPLRPVPRAKLDAAQRRTIAFHRTGGAWAINDRFVDLERALVSVARGRPQIWTLENGGGGWWHPIHIHISNMRVLERNGKRPGPLERDGMAKKNTVLLAGGDKVKIFIEFRDFTGQTVFHCHNLEHEDHFMMGRLDITG